MKENNKKDKTGRSRALPPAFGCPCFELSGNRELLIEGGKGIIEYSPEKICVTVPDMLVSVSGRGLNLRCISDTAMMIDGYITCLEFTQ